MCNKAVAIWGFLKIRGTFSVGPYNKDYNFGGLDWGPPSRETTMSSLGFY